jgi:hypothetical protein
MKLRTLFSALALGSTVGLVATSSQAQQTTSPCETYKCVASFSGYGVAPTPSCAPALQTFLKIAVFNPPLGSSAAPIEHKFDPDATANERKKYLKSCPDAATDANTLNTIINKWMNVK